MKIQLVTGHELVTLSPPGHALLEPAQSDCVSLIQWACVYVWMCALKVSQDQSE